MLDIEFCCVHVTSLSGKDVKCSFVYSFSKGQLVLDIEFCCVFI